MLNPSLIKYREQIKGIISSKCELGVHGGRNHATWCKYALDWDEEKIDDEIQFAIDNIRSIEKNYTPGGFASPGWVSPECLGYILQKNGFKYCADFRCLGADDVVKTEESMSYIGVNMLGEPGGVAFFENCRAIGMGTDEIIEKVANFIEGHETTIIYDHPYYAGMNEINTIKGIINYSNLNQVEIVKLENLL